MSSERANLFRTLGIERVIRILRFAALTQSADPLLDRLAELLERTSRQLQSAQPVSRPDYIVRQLHQRALELGDGDLAERTRQRLQALEANDSQRGV
jgi:hypothetical protein